MDEDEVVAEAHNVVKAWQEAVNDAHLRVQALLDCGKDPNSAASQLPRLNAMVQDRLAALRSLMLRLELVAQQHPSEEESELLILKLEEWKEQEKAIRASLRNANIRAKLQTDQAVRDERELLLAGGEEASLRQRRLQTKAGMTAATESITDGLRRTRQLMAQEAERGVNTLAALDASNTTLRRADLEYKGHRTLLMRTRNLLTALQRQDVKDRVIMISGMLCFIFVCYYIFNKRIGLLKYRRAEHAPLSVAGTVGKLPDYSDYP